MKLKFMFNKKNVSFIIADIICIIMILVFSIISEIQIDSLSSQRVAEKWCNSTSKTDYSHISCFFSDDSEMNRKNVNSVRSLIENSLSKVMSDENSRIWIDTYSSSIGKYEVSGSKKEKVKAEITAVTSDFFLIHDFNFVNGSYFREEEISENGMVIDRNLAWRIFGSDDIIGMTAEINGFGFYISGVIDVPECDAENKTYGNLPRAYISCNFAEKITSEVLSIECFEVVMPNPVKNYAFNIINEFLKSEYPNTSIAIDNTERFSFSNNFKRLKDISSMVVADNNVSYTWWENSARVTEIKISINLLLIIIFSIFPVFTFIVILIKILLFCKSNNILKHYVKAGKVLFYKLSKFIKHNSQI